MRRLLNTLFVTSDNIYLSLEGENVVASQEKKYHCPLSPSHTFRYYQFCILRGFSGTDGRVCQAWHFSVFLQPER